MPAFSASPKVSQWVAELTEQELNHISDMQSVLIDVNSWVPEGGSDKL